VVVNLAALPETILEGELFGYEKGAFTGAVAKRDGRIAQAEGRHAVPRRDRRAVARGAGEAPARDPGGRRSSRSAARHARRTSGSSPRRTSDLRQLVSEGRFREDLYYRLNVIAITSPPLRSRQGDVPLLVDHFLDVYCKKNGKARLTPTPDALERLVSYHWPGNVRELENVIERAVVLGRTKEVAVDDLPPHVAQAERRGTDLTFSLGTPLEEIERRVIKVTLEHTKGDKQLAAQLLGISARTIYRKLAEEAGGDPSAPPTAE
jgi:transcriptional regulator with PAS, ATPase and Fis domain